MANNDDNDELTKELINTTWLLPVATILNVYFPSIDRYFKELKVEELHEHLEVMQFMVRLAEQILELGRKRNPKQSFKIEQLVGFAGFARSGKDTCADYLVTEHNFTKASFAENLREFALKVDPFLSKEITYSYGELLQQHGYEEAKKIPKVRQYLINIGESMRQYLHPKIWIQTLQFTSPKVVISDVRYPNEARFIQKLNGVVIRIVRINNTPIHETEKVSVDAIEHDHLLRNETTIQDMVKTLDHLLHL